MPVMEMQPNSGGDGSKRTWVAIPEDTVLEAEVRAVKQVKKPFKADDGSDIWKVEFEFAVEHNGKQRKLWGETPTTFSSHPDCKLTNWVTAILGRTVAEGESLNTDVLVGEHCRVMIGQRSSVKDGEQQIRNHVKDVIPSRSRMAQVRKPVVEQSFDDSF